MDQKGCMFCVSPIQTLISASEVEYNVPVRYLTTFAKCAVAKIKNLPHPATCVSAGHRIFKEMVDLLVLHKFDDNHVANAVRCHLAALAIGNPTVEGRALFFHEFKLSTNTYWCDVDIEDAFMDLQILATVAEDLPKQLPNNFDMDYPTRHITDCRFMSPCKVAMNLIPEVPDSQLSWSDLSEDGFEGGEKDSGSEGQNMEEFRKYWEDEEEEEEDKKEMPSKKKMRSSPADEANDVFEMVADSQSALESISVVASQSNAENAAESASGVAAGRVAESASEVAAGSDAKSASGVASVGTAQSASEIDDGNASESASGVASEGSRLPKNHGFYEVIDKAMKMEKREMGCPHPRVVVDFSIKKDGNDSLSVKRNSVVSVLIKEEIENEFFEFENDEGFRIAVDEFQDAESAKKRWEELHNKALKQKRERAIEYAWQQAKRTKLQKNVGKDSSNTSSFELADDVDRWLSEKEAEVDHLFADRPFYSYQLNLKWQN